MTEAVWTDGTDIIESDVELSTFQATKVVNKRLAEAGVDKVIPSQMIYNYTTARLRASQKPLIVSSRKVVGDKEVTVILESNLEEWMKVYVRKAVLLASLND